MENQSINNATVNNGTINNLLKEKGLWIKGCQFLSLDDKIKLLNGNARQIKKIHSLAVEKLSNVASTLSSMDRSSQHYEFNKDTEILSLKGVKIAGNVEELNSFMFPVKEDVVYFSTGTDMVIAPNHKAITTDEPTDNKIISVVKKRYNMVSNKDLILPMLERLDKLDNKWYVDNSHSFVSDDLIKMRLQLTFPELTFNDGKSDVAMSLFLNNSYDGSSSVSGMWGAIRGICKNGMVFGTVMSKFQSRHSSLFDVDFLSKQIEETYKMIPLIQERVSLLQQQEFLIESKIDKDADSTIIEDVDVNFGKRASQYVDENLKDVKTMWDFYNVMTYFISHYVNYKQREIYQKKLSNYFQF